MVTLGNQVAQPHMLFRCWAVTAHAVHLARVHAAQVVSHATYLFRVACHCAVAALCACVPEQTELHMLSCMVMEVGVVPLRCDALH